MKIGLFTSGYMYSELEDAFRDARKYGYHGIEIWGGRPHAYPYDLKRIGVHEIVNLSKKYDIPIIGYTPEMNAYPFNMMLGDEYARKESLDYIKLSMDLAKEMGAGFTLISAAHAGYNVTRQEINERLLMNLEELVQHANKIEHKLVLEPLTPYESNVITSVNDLVDVFKKIDSKYLVTMCDICAPFVQNEPIMNYFNKLDDKLQHLHIVDSDGQSDTHYIPGEGKIPFKQLINEINNTNYNGYFTIELVTAYRNEPSLYSAKAIQDFYRVIE